MKGVILAGGTGARLCPLTRVTNKHLLPVYDKPMLYYPLQTLVDAGIKDILIVTGGNNAGDFLRLLRNGKDFGLKQLSFAYQEGEGGIADALRLAEPFAAGEKICVLLGDNILENGIQGQKEKFEKQEEGALEYQRAFFLFLELLFLPLNTVFQYVVAQEHADFFAGRERLSKP